MGTLIGPLCAAVTVPLLAMLMLAGSMNAAEAGSLGFRGALSAFDFRPGSSAETRGGVTPVADSGAKGERGAVKGEPAAPAASGFPPVAGIYRATGTNPNGTRYEGMTAIAAADGGYRFTWWIGKDVFRGTGRVSDGILVVEWGSSSPVHYSAADGGVLNGKWADGSASETLRPFGLAAEGVQPQPAGRYSVEGHNADGSRYTGSLTLTPEAGGYRVNWQVGNQTYAGTGALDGNLLTVDWGDATPVVYALTGGGRLAGLWGGGKGDEVLTPQR